jgi:predicted DsbA family dithiol-disulfide isomerase
LNANANTAPDPTALPVSIDIVSDVVCPWCFLGKRRLDRAIAASDVPVAVKWRPYQLDPTIPPEGKDRRRYLEDKFGKDGRIEAAHERLNELGRAAGIAFDFNAIKLSPNTLDAHRLIRWAASKSVGEGAQDVLAEKLFSLYFEQGANIGDHAVLTDAAEASGMDRAIVAGLLASDVDRAAVEEEIHAAQRMGVTGVPCFIIEGRYAIMGAQEPETLADALRQVAQMRAKGEMGTETP